MFVEKESFHFSLVKNYNMLSFMDSTLETLIKFCNPPFLEKI